MRFSVFVLKRPSTSMTHAADNDDIAPENAEPPNKKASKSGSRENTAFLKTVLYWEKDFTIDLGYRLSKLEGQSEVVEEIWCEMCQKFSRDRLVFTQALQLIGGGRLDSGKGDHKINALIHIFFTFIFYFSLLLH